MNYNWKASVRYLAYIVGFIILLIILSKVYFYFQSMQQATYKVVTWSIYASLTYILIGIYLGLPNFIREHKKTGKWKINFQKLIIIGLPALYFSAFWYLPFSYPIPEFLSHTNDIFRLGTIIVGYVLMDSFFK